MSQLIKIKKGLDIHLSGAPEKIIKEMGIPETVAVKPPDFFHLIPKLLVKKGDEVKAGTPLFYNKLNPSVKFCSPVSGEIADIIRGEKRRILEVIILADRETEYENFEPATPNDLSKEAITEQLLLAGLFPLIRQRPYNIIPTPGDYPKSIFISGFDSSPLAPDLGYVLRDEAENLQTGIDALAKLTFGKVHVSVHQQQSSADVFKNLTGVALHTFAGPHPAGNVGVQVHHIDPVNKGERVWCVHPQDVAAIGRFFNTGKFQVQRTVAVTGSQVADPKYFKTILGTSIKALLHEAGVKEGVNRIISGNVLSGRKITEEGYLGFYDHQLTVIPEGTEPEFMGWIAPGFKKFSMSRAYFSWLTPSKYYDLNTNLHGEERPFVMTGQYEKVFPMDIYPVQLLKATLIEDIELMEQLGIYEVVEEDFALCEFVCTSKIESQQIIRKGLDLVWKEMS